MEAVCNHDYDSGSSSLTLFIEQHKHDVRYISQSYAWDCGLACTEMALKARGLKQVRHETFSRYPFVTF